MPAGSIERTNARKEEIINACEKLYQTMSFKDITLKKLEKKPVSQEHPSITIFRQRRKYFLHF